MAAVFAALSPLSAQELVITGAEDGAQAIGKRVLVLEDRAGLDIRGILSPEVQRRFIPGGHDMIIRGHDTGVLWIKAQVRNTSDSRAWIEISTIHAWFVDYYIPHRGGYRIQMRDGALLRRDWNSRNAFFVRLPLPAEPDLRTVYIRIVSQPGSPIPVNIGTTLQLEDRKTRRDYIFGGFIGVIAIAFFFNLFLLFTTKDRVYLWYILYALAALFSLTLLMNYPLIVWVAPESVSSFLIAHPSWRNLPFVFLGFFSADFLGLRSVLWFRRTLFFFLFGFLVVIPLQDFFTLIPGLTVARIGRPFLFAYTMFLLAAGFYFWSRDKERNAAYFVWGWIGAVGGTVTQLLTITGHLPLNLATENALAIGIALEAVLFSIALADRLRRANEKLLSRNTNLLRQTSVMAHIGGWEFLPIEGRFYWSEVVREMFDAPRGFIPRPGNAFGFYPDRKSRLVMARAFARCLNEGVSYDVELKMTTFKGREVWIRTLGEAEFERETCVRVFGTCQDITDRKETELKLIAARKAAEGANRTKSLFLATMSHEIRTPMSGVIGMASLLAETELDENQRRYVEVLNRSGENLLNLINDILDFSSIEAGKVRLQAEAVDPIKLCGEVVDLMTPRAGARQNVLDASFDPAISYRIRADELRLKQILSNLIGNAVKFTQEGAILLNVRETARSEDTVRLEFSVSDTGIGIAPEKIVELFKPFTQADGSIARRYGGTGLGLSICQSLVNLMGGTIGIDSTEGKGTKVYFALTFPLATEETAPPELSAGRVLPAPAAYSVLIVDDDPVIQQMLYRMLESLGLRVETAADGFEAEKKYKLQKYDFITMDTNMPGKSGLNVIREIREISGSSETPVIISISAAVSPVEARSAIAVGANDILTKPFTYHGIRQLFHKWFFYLEKRSAHYGRSKN